MVRREVDGELQAMDEPRDEQIVDPSMAFFNIAFLPSCWLNSVCSYKLCQQLHCAVEKAAVAVTRKTRRWRPCEWWCGWGRAPDPYLGFSPQSMFSEGVRGWIQCCISDFVLWLRKQVCHAGNLGFQGWIKIGQRWWSESLDWRTGQPVWVVSR